MILIWLLSMLPLNDEKTDERKNMVDHPVPLGPRRGDNFAKKLLIQRLYLFL
jgi:hypothetical protein